MSIASGGSCCHVLRRGRSANTFRHAAQESLWREQRTFNPRGTLVFAHAPDAPPRAQALVIQPTPALPQLASHTPFKHQGIEEYAMEPKLRTGDWSLLLDNRIHIVHTFPEIYKLFRFVSDSVRGP